MDGINSIQKNVFTKLNNKPTTDYKQRIIFKSEKDEFVKMENDNTVLNDLENDFQNSNVLEIMQTLVDDYYWQKDERSVGFTFADGKDKQILGVTVGVRDWTDEDADEDVMETPVSTKDFLNILLKVKNKQIKENPEIKLKADELYNLLSEKFAKTDDK